ncbi:MAG: HEAT repeat domain-containing protein [Desulfobacterales bacterium]|nr:HEAT repeat domain-containing protein [Desulfobacterales bacterium]
MQGLCTDMEGYVYPIIAFLAALNLVTICGILWIRLRNNRIDSRMARLEQRFDSLISEARHRDVDPNTAREILPPKDYPYFQRYLRKRISGAHSTIPHAERKIASLSGFSEHLRNKALKSVGWEKALALRSLSYLRDRDYIPVFRQILRTESHLPSLLAASHGLALCGDTESLPLITRKVFDKKSPNRDRLLAVLYGFGTDAAPEIQSFLDQEFLPEDMATVLVDLLALYRHRPAGPTLERIARTTASPELRLHAVEALGFVGHYRATDTLHFLLKDEDFRVRLKAVRALAMLDVEGNREILRARLEDENEWVRLNAAEAMLDRLSSGEGILRELCRSDSGSAGRVARLVLLDSEFNRKRWRYKDEEPAH